MDTISIPVRDPLSVIAVEIMVTNLLNAPDEV
jgi:hypothetical protein